MSELVTNKITPSTGSSDTVTLGDSGDTFTIPSGVTMTNSGTATGFGGGKILQVVQTVVSAATASTTSASMVDVAGMTVDITPSATTSKILVFVDMKGAAAGTGSAFGLMRDTTVIYAADSSGAHTLGSGQLFTGTHDVNSATAIFLDDNTPADTTTAITYKVQWETNGGVFYLNRPQTATDADSWARVSSSITVMEMGA